MIRQHGLEPFIRVLNQERESAQLVFAHNQGFFIASLVCLFLFFL